MLRHCLLLVVIQFERDSLEFNLQVAAFEKTS